MEKEMHNVSRWKSESNGKHYAKKSEAMSKIDQAKRFFVQHKSFV